MKIHLESHLWGPWPHEEASYEDLRDWYPHPSPATTLSQHPQWPQTQHSLHSLFPRCNDIHLKRPLTVKNEYDNKLPKPTSKLEIQPTAVQIQPKDAAFEQQDSNFSAPQIRTVTKTEMGPPNWKRKRSYKKPTYRKKGREVEGNHGEGMKKRWWGIRDMCLRIVESTMCVVVCIYLEGNK